MKTPKNFSDPSCPTTLASRFGQCSETYPRSSTETCSQGYLETTYSCAYPKRVGPWTGLVSCPPRRRKNSPIVILTGRLGYYLGGGMRSQAPIHRKDLIIVERKRQSEIHRGTRRTLEASPGYRDFERIARY